MSCYQVGQKLYLRNVNERLRGELPPVVIVTRVGSKLVYVSSYGREEAYRIDSGRRNDAYAHSWLQTFIEWDEQIERSGLVESLKSFGFEICLGRTVTTDTMRMVIAALYPTTYLTQ